MARLGFNFTKTTATQSGTDVAQPTFTPAGNDGGTALAAAIGVLVADGATPTQAHVTTANVALPTVQGDISISFDSTKITTVNQLKAAFATALQAARGSGIAEG